MQTTKKPTPQFVPASLLRVRCFLNTEGNIQVKPWATLEETLDAFHDALVSNRRDDAFWEKLKALLAILSDDLKQRISARAGEVIDNDLLDREYQFRLLDEIRTALSEHTGKSGGFRRLVASLLPSPPAIGLLAILGSVVTQGCYASNTGPDTQDAATDQVDGSNSNEMKPEDASSYAEYDSGSASAQTKDIGNPIPDTGRDTPTIPPETDTGVPVECRSSEIGLVEIVNSCVTNAYHRREALNCIENLNESWRTGLTKIFRCEDCDTIAFQLENYLSCDNACITEQEEFDRDAFLDGCGIPIYVGVRFE